MYKEVEMIMCGEKLTIGQAITVRVALESLATTLVERGLGDDEHGIAMTKGYLARISEMRTLMG